ncbi:MAG: NUDIX hydrolase [Candidatus Levybacteria bacterium]|nr:NUDIX hydrolase [Candidatus Levybacteria bacterium]
MTEIIPSVAVLIIKNGKVLLVKHTEKAGHLTGIYGLPGGRLDLGEDEIEAAKRELEEETGLQTTIDNLLDFPGNLYITDLERKDGIKTYSWRVFFCRVFKGEIKKAEETIPEWVEIGSLKNYNLLKNTEDVVKKGLKL